MTPEYGSLPFDEQIEFFRTKRPALTRAWTDVYAAEHDHAFMVAGAAKADLLADLRTAVDRAIADGTTLQTFRKDFDAIVEKHGWPYKGPRAWRTRVIYETNIRQSFAAGRETQMSDPELRKRRPFGLYRHGESRHPREAHLAWDGLVLPLDDPWWDTHTPQNGWGCKCRKQTLSQRDLDRKGWTVDDAPPVNWRDVTVGENGPSPRTVRVPEGIDPGFEHRPGAARASALLAKTRDWPPEIAAAAAAGWGETARAAVAAEYAAWIDQVIKDGRPSGRAITLWGMEPAELAHLRQRGRTPVRADVTLEDRIVVGKKARRHAEAGNALSETQWRGLAAARPEAVLYDKKDGRLLYVLPAPGERKIKVVVAPDYWDKKSRASVNSVRTAFAVARHVLTDGRYEIVRGEVK